MVAFRQAGRGRGWITRKKLLREVAGILGYERLGSRIARAFKGHLKAAIRRKIIEADGPDDVRLATPSMASYWDDFRDDFINLLCSVMTPGREYEREEVVTALAAHLGFARVRETVESPIRSAINAAIRRGLLGYEGNLIWRL